MAETEAAPEAAAAEVPVKEEVTPEIQKKIVKQMEVSLHTARWGRRVSGYH